MASDNRFRFTKDLLDEVTSPTSKSRKYIYDTHPKANGLGLSITKNDVKTYFIYRRVNGIPKRVTIGRFDRISLENARKTARTYQEAIEVGEDPSRKSPLGSPNFTFGQAFKLYLENYAQKEKRSWKQDEGIYNRRLKKWAMRKFDSITQQDIKKLHTKIDKRLGMPYAANRMLMLVSGIYSYMSDEHGYAGSNPAKGIKKAGEKSRERYLTGDELKPFLKAVREDPNVVMRNCILMCLFTGARKSNVLAMRHDEIDHYRKIWIIPQPKGTKGSGSHELPMVDEAMELVAEMTNAFPDSEWVFPSKGKTGHLVDLKSAWKRILDRSGIQNFRIHDVRRTLGSWQANMGVNLHIIGKSLNHKDHRATEVYARLDHAPVRESLDNAVAAMLKAGESTKKK